MDIALTDILQIADKYTIKNPKGIIENMQNGIELWKQNADKLGISERVISSIVKDFRLFL
jgi:serine/threonine-protein kinase HipA